MIRRLFNYIWQSFHPFSKFFFSGLLTFGLLYVNHIRYDLQNTFVIGPEFIIGTVTTFFLLLYIRIEDDIKDYDYDMKYHPLRPIPSGSVHFTDLKILIYIISIAVFILNVALWSSFIPFILLFFYLFLWGKWFYKREKISKSRVLTLLMHLPVPFLTCFYIISLYTSPHKLSLLTSDHFFWSLWWIAPYFAWEISQRIKVVEDERPPYNTFSFWFGFNFSILLPLLIIGSQLVLLFKIAGKLNLAPITMLLEVGLVASLSLFIISVLSAPTREKVCFYSRVIIIYSLLSITLLFIDFYLSSPKIILNLLKTL